MMVDLTHKTSPGPRIWVPNFKVVETLVSTAMGVKQLVAANSDRVAIVFSATLAGSGVYITTVPTAAIGQGIQLIQNSLVYTIAFSTHGGLVQSAFYANASGPGATVSVMESIWLPGG